MKPPDGQPCCGYCNPDDSYIAQNKSHQLLIDSMSEMASGKGKDPRTDRKYAAQRPGEAKGLVLAKLKDWRRERWLGTPGMNNFVGPMAIIPDSILTHLSRKLHILSTRERFDQVVRDWSPAKRDQHGSALYVYGVTLITELDVEHQERRRIATLEGENDLELGESSPLDIEEIEGDGEQEGALVDEELPTTATAVLQQSTRTSRKRNTPPMPSKTHKHRDTRAKLDEPPIEKLFIRISRRRPPHTS